MWTAVVLVPLLVLGWTRTMEAMTLPPELPAYTTQENFDLNQFLGTWHDVAVATTCPHMRGRGDKPIGKLLLETGTTEGILRMTRTAQRHGSCKEMVADYHTTSTPGKFFFHCENCRGDVDAYVVHTNYVEYAIVIMRKHRTSGTEHTSLKLYSRSMEVRDSVLEDFKTLAREQGLPDSAIKILTNKGDCVPGEELTQTDPEPEAPRVKRQVPVTLPLADVEGSGSDDTPLFNGTQACAAAPDTGPCFGLFQHFYYNASSMSCELFNYGGCLGNQNNFAHERDCLQRCRTEAVCRLPMAAQPCAGQPVVWAFDSAAGLCVAYKPGFCQTNGNKFYTKSECEEYCGVVKDDAEFLNTN